MTEQENVENEMHKDSKNWKLDAFYYNPKDKRLFVPKRESKWNTGSTANFAHPVTYLLFLPIMMLPMVIIIGYAVKS